MPGPRRAPTIVLLGAALAVAVASGCVQAPERAAATSIVAAAPEILASRTPIVLLGEVHDNATQHAMRLEALKAIVAAGARPALLMEQFDRERQDDLERARRGEGGVRVDADAIIAAASTKSSGWDWAYYRPFLTLALEHDLPIVAANVSRRDAFRIAMEGLAGSGFDAAVPADISERQTDLIVRSHCDTVDAAQGRKMADAQVARDQFMARTIERWQERGVVLLAGNGHVRRDIGVPRWLAPSVATRTVVVGLIEVGDDAPGEYDRTLVTPRASREDPCAALRARHRRG